MKNRTISQSLPLAALIILTVSASAASARKKSPALFPEYNISEINSRSLRADSASRSAVNRMEIINGSLLSAHQELDEIREAQEAVSPARLEELETQLALLTEAFKDLYAMVAGIKVLPQIKYVPIKPAAPKGFNLSDAGDLLLGDEQALYQRAMELYRRDSFAESRQLFTTQLEKYPHGTLSDRASYWIGETYFAEKAYAKAAFAFASAEKYHGSSKGDDALYKQAVCYVKMGENDTARELFNTLIGRYPASEYVDKSQKQVEKLSI